LIADSPQSTPSLPPSLAHVPVPTAADDVGLQEVGVVGSTLRCLGLSAGGQEQGQVPGIVLGAQRGQELGFGSDGLCLVGERKEGNKEGKN